jgi:hypothetical protein
MKRLIFLKYKETLISYAFAMFMVFFCFNAGEGFFVEDGPVEFAESIALVIGIIMCLIEYRKNRTYKHFFLACAVILAFCIGRELSWGRVFYRNDMGEILKRKDWVFGPYLLYVLVPSFIALGVYMYKTKFVNNSILFIKKAPLMIPEFILIICSMAISIMAEQNALPQNIQQYHYAVEESAEIVLYFIIAMVIYIYSKYNLLNNIK